MLRREAAAAKYRTARDDEYRDDAIILNNAIRRGASLQLRPEKAAELGVTDPRDPAQLEAAREKALERAQYWSSGTALDEADRAAMEAEIASGAAGRARRSKALGDLGIEDGAGIGDDVLEAIGAEGESQPDSAAGGASQVSRPRIAHLAGNGAGSVMPGRNPTGEKIVAKEIRSRKRAENSLGDYAAQAGVAVHGILNDLCHALGMRRNAPSLYKTFTADDGSRFSVRLSNHSADAGNYNGRGNEKGRNLSIAIARERNRPFRANDNVVLKEFEYSEKALTAKDCRDIALALRDALRNGGDYRLTGAATGNAIQNGDSGFWTARDLAHGIAVMVSPQTRLLLRLDPVR